MNTILIISSIAISHGLFWAVVLIGMNDRLSNRLLAALLIALSFRVGKSVLGILFTGHMYLFASIGAVSMSAVGPLLFLFARSLFNSDYKLGMKDWVHFLPTLMSLILASLPEEWGLNTEYYLFTTSVAVYLVATLVYLRLNRETFRTDDMKWKWIHFILLGIGILWLTFVCQLLFYQPLVYLSIVVAAAVIFYSLSWYAIPRAKLFISEPARKVSDVQAHQELGDRILKLLNEEAIYTNTDLTVSTLAVRLKVPAYIASRAINQCFNKSFSELIVEYRIRKSEELLMNDVNKSLTVEAIAFESGFNTLSAFYKAFKKVNGMTPSQFRDTRAPHLRLVKSK